MSDLDNLNALIALVGSEDLGLRTWEFFIGVLEEEAKAAAQNARFYSTLAGPREHSRQVERVMHGYASAMREERDLYLSEEES